MVEADYEWSPLRQEPEAPFNNATSHVLRRNPQAEETVSQLFFDKRILEKDKKARESFLSRYADMVKYP